MRILVTGGAGYIGSHTCVELLNAGYDAVVVDDLRNSSEKAIARVKQITGKPLPFHKTDVCDRAALDAVLDGYDDIVCAIHFAGLKAVGESVEKPLQYYRNNLDATMTLCEALTAHGIKRLIFSSSATVYRPGDAMPLAEGYELGCTNPYGWTKFVSEQILMDLCAADGEFSAVLLRYFNPVGAHESGLIGEDPRGIPNNLMPYICQTAVGRRERLNVFGNDYPTPDGTGVRDYIHVCDLARGHVAAIEYALKHTGAIPINLGTGNGVSVLELLHAFEQACGHRIPYAIAGRRAGDVAECYADPSRAYELLGWKARCGIDRMCEDAWRWQSENPMGYGE